MNRKFKYSALALAMIAAQDIYAQGELVEITVTAQYREETLQDAGLAIDAVSGQDITTKGITSGQDLAMQVPALMITFNAGFNAQLYMRGVGNRATNDYLDPAITVNYDGVPIARGAGGSLSAYYDMERVEVLKGPQGTLYGRNATGGVINLIPVKPVLGETSGSITAGAGNYGMTTFTGVFNTPIGENSAFRIAANTLDRDGYSDDGTNDADNTNVRAQFYTEVNEDLSIRLAGDFSDIGGVGSGTTPVGRYQRTSPGVFDFIPSGVDPKEGSRTPAAQAFRRSILGAPAFAFYQDITDDWYVDGEMKGVNAEIKYNTDIGEFTIIPAWRNQQQDNRFGHPGFSSGWFVTDVTQKTLEVRLAGETDGPIAEYLVGGFYFDEESNGNNTFNQEFVLPMQDFTQKSDSKAVFGQLTWRLSDNARLITGVRYTDDHKDMNGSIDNYIAFCGGLGPNLITPPASFRNGCHLPGNAPHWPTFDTPAQTDAWLVENGLAAAFIPIPPGVMIPLTTGTHTVLHAISSADTTFDKSKTTYRAALEMDVLEDSLFYASFETGYRAGGLEPTGGTFRPEFIDAYTVGMKNRFLDGSLQINAEIFHWQYEDQQITYFNLNDDGVLQNTTDNVGESTNEGFDVDVLWAAAENTLLSAKVQHLNNSYDDLHFRSTIPRDNINCPSTVLGILEDGDPDLDFDCSGNQSVYSPDWTVQLGITQTFPLNGMDLIASFYTTYTDDQLSGFNNLQHDVIDSYTLSNLDLTLLSNDNSWSVSAWVRNIEDDRNVQATQTPLLGMAFSQYGPDMTYGARFNYNF